MKNLDLAKQDSLKERTAILEKMSQAITSNNAEEYAKAFNDLANSIEQSVKDKYEEAIVGVDMNVLAQRGVRQLTSEENKYYQSVINAMKSNNPKQALTDTDVVMPKTTIDSVFEEIKATHPLLDAINFMPTGALAEILLSTSTGVAAWGELTSTINSELGASFTKIDLGLDKLSAFIPINKSMLDLGPVWVDNYVRTILVEALSTQLETAIVSGDGKGKPIGMNRALTGAVDGVYPEKTPVAITDLSPATFGSILNTVSTGRNGKKRDVPELLMVVNPTDYYTKVFPATTPRTQNGTYSYDVFPYPTKKVVSASVPSGRAIFGLASKYFMGIGTSKGGKIEYDDSYRFLEDQRVYLIKLYGNGRALDENAFVYCDISGLKAYTQEVEVVNTVTTTPEI